ncbi:GNAT family N-acetyltransferase [Thalassotalea sp. M1531]|uniref:GNAT family N-acetyltransferase n=1 Tax=Thalassotalea algicola TaxID=2716224 RepID=A0A7Y0Q9B8_9GAMM|nr:GNAT family N-acetyltransferase [Thalassotalea algicola]NMP33050.1 GNAT family N-acetyltransferase [Thalassotalea algicola]
MIFRELTQNVLCQNGVTYSNCCWQSIEWYEAFYRYVCFGDKSVRILHTLEQSYLPVQIINSPKKTCFLNRKLVGLSNFYTPFFQMVSNNEADNYAACFNHFQRFLHQFAQIEFTPMISSELDKCREALEKIGFFVASHQCSVNWYEDNIKSVDDYWAKRPSKLKNTIRRKREKLVKAGEFHTVIHHGDNLVKALLDFHLVYFKSWKVNEPFPAFIDEIAKKFSQLNQLRMGFVYKGEVPVAAQMWFVSNGVASIFKLAHTPTYENQSVGSILTADMFNYVIDKDGVNKVDFLTGNDAYKKEWMSSSQPLYTLNAFNRKTVNGIVGMCKSILDKDQR